MLHRDVSSARFAVAADFVEEHVDKSIGHVRLFHLWSLDVSSEQRHHYLPVGHVNLLPVLTTTRKKMGSRASGMYTVVTGRTKSSAQLVSFIRRSTSSNYLPTVADSSFALSEQIHFASKIIKTKVFSEITAIKCQNIYWIRTKKKTHNCNLYVSNNLAKISEINDFDYFSQEFGDVSWRWRRVDITICYCHGPVTID